MNLIAACKLLLLSRCWHFPKFDFLLFLLYTHNQHALVNMKSLCLFVKYIDATPQLLIIINYNPSFWLTAEITRRWWTYKKKIIFMKFIIYPKLNNLIRNRSFYDDKILINGILYIRNMRLKQSHRFRAYSRKCLFSSSRYLWLVLLLILISLM